MVLADLVRPVTRWVQRAHERPLLTIVVLGTALFLITRVEPSTGVAEPLPLTVAVSTDADAREIDRATDEAILLAFAERAGFVHRDSAIRARLELNVRFVDPALEGDAAIDEAMRMEMHRSDPVVRERLVWLAQETLASATRERASDETLETYLREHPERFARPEAITFEQVFVSRQRDDFDARVAEVAAQPDLTLSDPSLLPARVEDASPRRIDMRFGRGFAAQLGGAEWTRIDSTFGTHFARVIERRPGTLPELDAIRARVEHEHDTDDRARRVREALRRMREAYRIEVRRS